MWCKFFAQTGNLCDVAGLFARERHRRDIFLRIVEREPRFRGGGVGQVGFVQNFKAGTLTKQALLGNDRVAARLRQARIQYLDDEVDILHGLGGFFARRQHVSGKPLNGHC